MQVIILVLAAAAVIRGSQESNSTNSEHAKSKRHLLLKNLLYAPKYPLRPRHQADHRTKGQHILSNARDDLVLLHRSLDWISRVTEFLRRRLPYPYINTHDFSFLSYYAPELYLDIPNDNHGPKPKVHITLKEEPGYNAGHHALPHPGPPEDFIVAASNQKPVYTLPGKESEGDFRKFIPITQPNSRNQEDKASASIEDADESEHSLPQQELSTEFNKYEVHAPKNETLVGYYASKSALNKTRYGCPESIKNLFGKRPLVREEHPVTFTPLIIINEKQDRKEQPTISNLYGLPSEEEIRENAWRKSLLDQQGSQSTSHPKHLPHKIKFPVKPPLSPHFHVPVNEATIFKHVSENDGAGRHVEQTTFNLLPYFDIHKRFFNPNPFPNLRGPIVVPVEEDFDWNGHRSFKKDHEDSEDYLHVGHLPLEGHAIFDKNKLALYNSYGQFI